jgi:hypothetical protein
VKAFFKYQEKEKEQEQEQDHGKSLITMVEKKITRCL